MNLSVNGISTGDKKPSTMKAPLNPNAAEFIPMALRSSSEVKTNGNASSKLASPTATSNGKAILDRSESSVSNNSDDEAYQFWRAQLPDDITPDFNFMGMDDNQVINNLPLANLSLSDDNDGSRFINLPSRLANGEQLRHSVSSIGEYSMFQPSVGKHWERQIIGNDHLPVRGHHSYAENSQYSVPFDVLNEALLDDNAAASRIKYLASQFPGFAVESLAEVYFANGGDLNLTIEMLTQLELQVDGGLNQSFESKNISSPTLTSLDFPILAATDSQNGSANFASDDHHLGVNPHHATGKENTTFFRSNSSIPSRLATDFASAVRKMTPRDGGIWNYGKTGNLDTSHIERFPNRGSAHGSPIWLETGAAVANMYSEMREEARDHARVRNVYFEQSRQAYINGNKALAKDLSIKGHLHNIHMKAAHGKAQDSIYRQRNPEVHSSGHERMIDLHGLHVNEAIHVLKLELAVIRNTARVTDQRLIVDICVGTGHHTRGSRTPARLPVAVQRYLLDEGIVFTEPQPGLLRIVVY